MNLILYFTFNFLVYGFLGWILENGFSYFRTGHMQGDGFLYMPFKPMYAIAMSALVLISKAEQVDTYLMLSFCFIIPTFVEFITGLIMRYYFKKNYWDYSDLKYNYKGIICLGFSMIWMLLSFLSVEFIQVYFIDIFYLSVKGYWEYLWVLFVIALVLDDMRSIKNLKVNRRIIN